MKKSMSSEIRSLEIGGKCIFSILKAGSIKNIISERSLIWGMSFTTHVDREAMTIEVTRTA